MRVCVGADIWYGLAGTVIYTALKAAGTTEKTAVMAQLVHKGHKRIEMLKRFN